MKYSLVVSIYKVEKYLQQCIESILAQTHSDFELILVDDGSPDRCPQICDEYANRDKRIRVIHKENGGLMSTRRVGIAAATGEYICFIDGDDFIDCDMLQTYEGILKQNAVDVICTGFSAYYADGNEILRRQRIPCGIYKEEKLVKMVYSQMLSVAPFFTFYVFPSVCCKCFRRVIVEKVYQDISENISLGEDVAASYPALLLANSIYVVDYCGYKYRQNPESMTHTYNKGLYKKIKELSIHLKTVEKECQWDAGIQIDEYIIFLLQLAKNNELFYNLKDGYKVKKRNLKLYLNDELFMEAIRSVKMKSIKDKVILACFRYKIILPLYLIGIKKFKKGC